MIGCGQHVICRDPLVDVAHRDKERLPGKDIVIGPGNLDVGAVLMPGCGEPGDPGRHQAVALTRNNEDRRGDRREVDRGGLGPIQPGKLISHK